MNENIKPLAVGDWVIVGKGGDYAGLTGKITEIHEFGSPEHDTDNPTDDIVVDLSVMDYSGEMQEQIAEKMERLGYETNSYDDVCIDCVILAPDDLIRISEAELTQYENALTDNLKNALSVGEMLETRQLKELQVALNNRVQQNYADYEVSLENFGTGELIGMAATIHAWSDARSYMLNHRDFSVSELRFYLQFENPLEIIANSWRERCEDLYELGTILEHLNDPEHHETELEDYPLYNEKPKPERKSVSDSKTEQTPYDRLCEKMSAEFDAFVDDLKTKPPAAIIKGAYQKVFMEDLLMTVENGNLSDEQINALLSLDKPLGELYQDWLDSDASYMDLLQNCVEYRANEVIKERSLEQEKFEPFQTADNRKPAHQQFKQPYSLLGDLKETQAEANANKAEKAAEQSKDINKIKKSEVDL